ncbi:uncharacterized protein BX663DRAFT_521259 [Cokeromyces recurvatus]|uniref:uncharacterized protein n=1 Tax=Cokeromyces recurvatus TaxID=90255 RepID=UPI0022205D20|nr:uncharacterized protein BX663DRAFT_521259 [Cokeromyces recurvatus]KAI7899546.1 hypothetical protein BX663DRAFT_521259 [Cokeromyces recurvatus]
MPLYSTMLEYGATVDSWTLRAATYDNGKPKENLNMLLPNKEGREIVLNKVDLQAPHQGLAASWLSPPMCFERAIIGTGNRCSLWYCEGQIPTEHYDAYRSFVMKEPYDKNKNKCAASVVVHHAMGEKTIGILNRRYTRHITNVPELIQALTKENYRVLSIDFDVEGCDLINTAHVVNDLDVLIAPFGNGLGAGLFMKSDAILISISARYYSEQWFKYPMTAIGRRIFDFSCHQASCEEYDEALAQKLLGVPLNETELQTFFMMRPDEVDTSYLLQTKLNSSSSSSYEERWQRYLQYHKDVARRIDVERFIPYLKEIILRDHHQSSSSSKDVPFPETCKTPNVCCDLDCEGPLERNVFGEQNAWKNKGYKYIKEAK